jgi:hypothetical protein
VGGARHLGALSSIGTSASLRSRADPRAAMHYIGLVLKGKG